MGLILVAVLSYAEKERKKKLKKKQRATMFFLSVWNAVVVKYPFHSNRKTTFYDD